MQTATIQADDSRWPLVTVRFIGNLTEDDFQLYLSFLTLCLERAAREGRKNAFIFDTLAVGRVSSTTRRLQAEWMSKNALACRAHSAGYAFVIASPLVRGLLTAILWISPMPAPHEIVATISEAEAWLREQLAH